jgi:hypothetical protein
MFHVLTVYERLNINNYKVIIMDKSTVNDAYLDDLARIDNELKEQRKANKLPPLTRGQDEVLQQCGVSFGCYRALKFLFSNQGARTDIISAQCAVGNVSDTFIGLRKRHTSLLDNIGLSVSCKNVKAMNRFGRKTTIGTWWLEIADQAKWETAQVRAKESKQAA